MSQHGARSRRSRSKSKSRKSRARDKAPSRTRETAPKHNIKKLPIINKGPAIHTPRTGNISSHQGINIKRSHASENMSLTDLQFMARAKGIPFGGLTKGKLVRKINAY